MAGEFDPDAFLAETPDVAPDAAPFDPDAFLAETPDAPVSAADRRSPEDAAWRADQEGKLEAQLAEEQAQEERLTFLAEGYRQSIATPDPEAGIQKLATYFNIPTSAASARKVDLDVAMKVAQFDARKFQEEQPELAAMLLRDRETSKTVHKDVPLIGVVKKFRGVQDAIEDFTSIPAVQVLTTLVTAGADGPGSDAPKSGSPEEAAAYSDAQAKAPAERAARDAPKRMTFTDNWAAKYIREHAPHLAPFGELSQNWEALAIADLSSGVANRILLGVDEVGTSEIERRIIDRKRNNPKLDLGETGLFAEALVGSASTSYVMNPWKVGRGSIDYTLGLLAAVPVGLLAARGGKPGKILVGAMLAKGTFSLEQGSLYDESESWRTDKGEALTKRERAAAATVYATGSTAIEMGEFGILAGLGKSAAAFKLPGGKAAFGAAFKALTMRDPAFRGLLLKAGAALVGEPAEEGTQALFQSAIGYFAKSLKDGQFQKEGIGQAEVEDALAQASAVMPFSVAQTAMSAAIGRVAGSLDRDNNLAGNGQAKAVAGLKDSPTVRAAPEAVARMIEDATAKTGNPVTHFYVDAEILGTTSLFQSANAEEGQSSGVDELLGPGGAERLADAIAVGGKVEIPAALYLSKWAGTPTAAALAEHTTTRAGHLTPAQLAANPGLIEERAKDLIEEAEAAQAEEAKAEELFKGMEADLSAVVVDKKGKKRAIGKEAAKAKVSLFRAVYRTTAAAYGHEVAAKEVAEARFEIAQGRTATDESTPQETSGPLDERAANPDPKQRAGDINIDPETGLRNFEAWNAEPRKEGQDVAALTLLIKPINDDVQGGHETANAFLAKVAPIIYAADTEAARKGPTFLFHGRQGDLDAVMQSVRAQLPAGFEIAGQVRKDTQRAIDAVEAEVTEGRKPVDGKPGRFPEDRSKTSVDLAQLPALEQGLGERKLVTPNLSKRMLDDAARLKPGEMRETYRDKVVPELLSATGWRHIPRKAFAASLDLKGLKRVNELFARFRDGRKAGNQFIAHFGRTAVKVGAQSVDMAHMSGDEYAIQSDTQEDLDAFLDALDEALRANDVHIKMGEDTQPVHVRFRDGIGATYGLADRALNVAKKGETAGTDLPRAARRSDRSESRPEAGMDRGVPETSHPEAFAGREEGDAREVGENRLDLTWFERDPRSPEEVAELREHIARMTKVPKREWATKFLDFILAGSKGKRPGRGGLSDAQRHEVVLDFSNLGFVDPDARFHNEQMVFPGNGVKTLAEASKASSDGNGGLLWIYHHQADYYLLTPSQQLDVELGLDPSRGGKKSSGSLFQSEKPRTPGPVWHSAVAKAVETTKQDKNSPQAWLAVISKTPGVKLEEIEWLGLKEWLDQQKGSIARADVLAFVKANQVEVTDAVVGADGALKAEQIRKAQDAYSMATGAWRNMDWDEEVSDREGNTLSITGSNNPDKMLADRKRLEQEIDDIKTSDEYAKPEGDDEEELAAFGELEAKLEELAGFLEERASEELLLAAKRRLDEVEEDAALAEEYARKALKALRQGDIGAAVAAADRAASIERNYGDSPVWGGFAEAVTAVEEAGDSGSYEEYALGGHKPGSYREILFRTPASAEFESKHFGDAGKGVLAHARVSEHETADGKRILVVEEIQSDLHQAGREEGYASNAVPDAPFKATWEEMVAKRMLRLAAEEGFDQIAWPTGEQQAERFDLSKSVDRLNYNGQTLAAYRGGRRQFEDFATPEQLPGIVGREVAAKLLAQPEEVLGDGDKYRVLEGSGLSVGGEGMKSAYNQRLPKIFEKLTKKHGGKVGKVKLDSGDETWSVTVPEALKKLVLEEGQPLFQAAWHGTPHDFEKFELTAMGTGEGHQAYGWGMYFAGNRAVADKYRTDLTNDGPRVDRSAKSEDSPRGTDRALSAISSGISAERTAARESGKPFVESPSMDFALNYARKIVKDQLDFALVQSSGSRETTRAKDAQAALTLLEQWTSDRLSLNNGKLFKVEVPEDHELLDYDKRLDEQPPEVIEKLEAAGILPNGVRVVGLIREYLASKDRDGDRFKELLEGLRTHHESGPKLPNGERFDGATKGRHIYGALSEGLGGPERASKALREAGIPGMRFLDQGSRGNGNGTHNYVIWDESRMPVTEKLYQPDGGSKPRGSVEHIQRGLRDIFRIALNPNADLSTWLHESGHVFLEILTDIASRPDAPERVKADFAAAMAFLGKTDPAVRDPATGWSFTREQHEKWADGFLVYLREGKAPSAALRSSFKKFSSWLKELYKSALQLGVEINPEIRGVFDRLLATDEEIASMRREMGKPLFGSLAQALAAGLTPSKYAEWLEDQAAANSQAERAAKLRIRKEELRKKDKQWKTDLAAEMTAAEAEYEALPARQAQLVLSSEGNGEYLGPNVALDRAAVEAAVGVAAAKKFRLAKEGGVSPDEIADQLGFATGAEMLKAIEALPSKDVWAKKRAEGRMGERFPGVLEDREQLRDIVGKGLHGDETERSLLKEIEALTARAPDGSRPVESIALAAKRMVERTPVGKLSPSTALRSERKAANLAVKALAKGNLGEVLTQKHRQLLAMYMYRELQQARDERDAFEALTEELGKTNSRERLGKSSPVYLGGVDLLLEAVSQKQPEQRETPLPALFEVVALMKAQTAPVLFDEAAVNALLSKSKPLAPHNPTELGLITLAQMRHVSDALKNIRGAARERSTVTNGETRAEKEHIVALAIEQARAFKKEVGGLASSRSARTAADIVRALPSAASGPLLKIELMAEWLGGSLTGANPQDSAWYQYFIKPMEAAKVVESDIIKNAVGPILEAFEKMPSSIRKRSDEFFNGKLFFPGHKVDSGQNLAPPSRRFELLVMALHMGTESSMERLTLGRNITEEQVMAAINTLTKEEFDWVQSVWDATEKLKAPAFDVAERESGLRPKALAGRTLRTVHGDYAGKYFPAMYDARVERAGKVQDSSTFMDPTFGSHGTPHGFTSARVEGFTGALSLEPSDIPRNLAQVAHYIAYQEAVKSVGKLVIDPRIQAVLYERLGEGRAKQFEQWVKDVGTARGVDGAINAGIYLKTLKTIRANTTIGALGFSIKNAVEDLSTVAWAPFASDITARSVSAGLLEFAASPMEKIAEVEAKSGAVRAANDSRVRDLTHQIESLTMNPWLVLRPFRFLRRHAFVMQEMTFKATATPVWLGAYRQGVALDKGEAYAVEFADRVIRRVFPMNSTVNQAAVLRDKGWVGTTLQFFSFLSTAGNVTLDTMQKLAEPRDGWRSRVNDSASYLGFMIGLSIVGGILRGKGPDEDETWAEWASRKMLTDQMAVIPLVGADAGGWIDAKAKGREWRPRAGLLSGTAVSIGEAVMALGDDNADTAKKVLAIGRAAGPIGVTGVSQASATLKYWSELDEKPEASPADMLSGTVYGETKGRPLTPINIFSDTQPSRPLF